MLLNFQVEFGKNWFLSYVVNKLNLKFCAFVVIFVN